jgi:hypothetical protein
MVPARAILLGERHEGAGRPVRALWRESKPLRFFGHRVRS